MTENIDHVIQPEETECPKITLEQMLENLGLSNLYEKFISEGVDMDMLISLNNKDMKECMTEVGIKRFGDRHRKTETFFL